MTTDIDYESPQVHAQLAEMEASLERLPRWRGLTGTACTPSSTGRGIALDYALVDSLQRIIKEETGVTPADEDLLAAAAAAAAAAADERRKMRAVVKPEMAAESANLTSTVPEGHGENVSTDAEPVYISMPVELHLEQPLSPVINVPARKPSSRMASTALENQRWKSTGCPPSSGVVAHPKCPKIC